jgi:20S proteasome subunit beta 1
VQQALSHAMARDGSSGGVIRTVVIDKDGVTRGFIPNGALPFSLQPPPAAADDMTA